MYGNVRQKYYSRKEEESKREKGIRYTQSSVTMHSLTQSHTHKRRCRKHTKQTSKCHGIACVAPFYFFFAYFTFSFVRTTMCFLLIVVLFARVPHHHLNGTRLQPSQLSVQSFRLSHSRTIVATADRQCFAAFSGYWFHIIRSCVFDLRTLTSLQCFCWLHASLSVSCTQRSDVTFPSHWIHCARCARSWFE